MKQNKYLQYRKHIKQIQNKKTKIQISIRREGVGGLFVIVK